jgi:hypothetical protein
VTTVNPRTVAPPNPTETTATPTLISTVHGMNGKVYYIGQNGHLYFRGKDGNLVEFGTYTPVSPTSPNTAGLTQEQQQELQQLQQQIETRRNAVGANGIPVPGTATANGTVPTTTATGNTVANAQTELTQQQQLELQQAQQRVQTRQNAVGANGIPVPGAGAASGSTAVIPGTTTPTANGALPVPNTGSAPVNITGTVLSNDGKTFYVGANGFLYYRGQNGGLFIFGSGQPE